MLLRIRLTPCALLGLQGHGLTPVLDHLPPLRADGAHIRGLIANFLDFKWPELTRGGYVKILQTPVLRATKGAALRDFLSEPAYRAWAATPEARGFHVKYYKVLGTWKATDAKELLRAARPITLVGGAGAGEAMELAFGTPKKGKKSAKKRKRGGEEEDEEEEEAPEEEAEPLTEDRKAWVMAAAAAPVLPDYSVAQVTYRGFVDGELVNYSLASVLRALPSLTDGLKVSSRKVLHTVRARKYTTLAREVRVAQLAGAVSEATLYPHGEASLNTVITNLAQDHVGANNVNLLAPNGAFGTRLAAGKDAASPRYIYPYASDLLPLLLSADEAAFANKVHTLIGSANA